MGRFEWEQIINRARLGGLIAGNANGTRGGVSGPTFKAVALVWASHGNPDGSEVWPGDATLAVEAEVGLKVAQQVKRKLVELGLTEKVRSRSRKQRKGDEYRLTLPSDLLDHVEVLSPAQLKLRAVEEYEKRRGKRPTSAGSEPPTPPVGGPVDSPQDTECGESDGTPTDSDGHGVGAPVDPPQAQRPETCGGSDGATETACGGSDGTAVGGPPDRDTNPDRPPYRPTPTDDEVRTAVTGPRAPEPEDHDFDSRQTNDETRPTGCPDHGPAMTAGTRPDGTPHCPLCRVGAPPTPKRRQADGPGEDPEADHARQRISDQWADQGSRFRAVAPDRPDSDGNVIPFDRRRAS
ncbi:hypothetical protein [Verrucosispora sp. TAA-831]|uniref:hypothetical protein n=1 Tax=Verrucosispora sp. TAA-831 TaxID=3422227 RepID=UPI003D6E3911